MAHDFGQFSGGYGPAWGGPNYGAGTYGSGYAGSGGYGTGWNNYAPPNPYGSNYPGGNWGNAGGTYGAGGNWSYWPGYGYGQPNYRQGAGPISDQHIEYQVNDALDSDPMTANTDINASVKDHVVTLAGTVRSRRAKMIADHIAWNGPGVDDVHNRIEVQGRRTAPADRGAATADSK